MRMYKDSIVKHFEKAYYEGDGQDEEFLKMSIEDAIKDWAGRNYGGAQLETAIEYLNDYYGIEE